MCLLKKVSLNPTLLMEQNHYTAIDLQRQFRLSALVISQYWPNGNIWGTQWSDYQSIYLYYQHIPSSSPSLRCIFLQNQTQRQKIIEMHSNFTRLVILLVRLLFELQKVVGMFKISFHCSSCIFHLENPYFAHF